MRFTKSIFLAVMVIAFAAYAFDCLAMSTPEAAMQCCETMHCSSHGHEHSQNAARPCRPCKRPLCGRSLRRPRLLRLLPSQCCPISVHRKSRTLHQSFLPRSATRRPFPDQQPLHLFASDQSSSRHAASRTGVPRHTTFCWKEKMDFRNAKMARDRGCSLWLYFRFLLRQQVRKVQLPRQPRHYSRAED